MSRAINSEPPAAYLESPETLKEFVEPVLNFLYTARPTAVNLGAATRRLDKVLRKGAEAGLDAKSIAQALIAEGLAIDNEDVSRNREMSKWGGDWLVDRVKQAGGSGTGLSLMTVCNTGSLATSVRIPSGTQLTVSVFNVRNRATGQHWVSSRTYTRRESWTQHTSPNPLPTTKGRGTAFSTKRRNWTNTLPG